jgi:hypothetical protein
MTAEWPPPFLTGVDATTLERIKRRLDEMGGAQLEPVEGGAYVGIFASPRRVPTAGRSLVAAIEELLDKEAAWRATDDEKQTTAPGARARLKRWTTRRPPHGR